MTTPVPDPRFRDQLVEALTDWYPGPDRLHRGVVDEALLPLIAAEVEARVQAAANNDVAVEDVRAIAVALGLGGHARPYSAHELVQCEILPALASSQAAANQRAVEAVEPGLSVESNGRRLAWFTDDELAAELNRRRTAALAPVPPDANGGEER